MISVGARARRRRLGGRVVVVVRARLVGGVMDDGVVAADMHRLAMRRRVMIVRRLGAGKARTRAGQRDERRR